MSRRSNNPDEKVPRVLATTDELKAISKHDRLLFLIDEKLTAVIEKQQDLEQEIKALKDS